MLNMDQITLRTTLAQLEHATQDYVEWHANLLRTIVCGQPPDSNNLAEDARFNCPLGRWYYQQAPAELRATPAFNAVGAEHERLHRVAARVLREVVANESIVRDDFEELLTSSTQLRRELDSLRHEIDCSQHNHDELTGAYDRAEMLRELHEWHELAKRHVQTCCLVFMDLDHFKDINDRFGHHVGDEVLAGAVRFLFQQLRPYDKVFRYGGDEFLIGLPGADLAIGQTVIRRIRDGLEGRSLAGRRDGSALSVTASFGLALLDPDVSVEDCIERADQALLLAKTAGRNRAISWDESVTTSTRIPRWRIEDIEG